MARVIDNGWRALSEPRNVNFSISKFKVGGRLFSLKEEMAQKLGEARFVKILLELDKPERNTGTDKPGMGKPKYSLAIFRKQRQILRVMTDVHGHDPMVAFDLRATKDANGVFYQRLLPHSSLALCLEYFRSISSSVPPLAPDELAAPDHPIGAGRTLVPQNEGLVTFWDKFDQEVKQSSTRNLAKLIPGLKIPAARPFA